MANFKLKESADKTSVGAALAGVNIIPQTGFIMPYAGPTPLTTATGTSGTNTIVVASATGAFVGQGIYGTGLNNPGTGQNYITAVSGTTLTVAYPLTQSISSGSVRLCPVGWLLCDGNNGTPDLRGRFLVGARSSANLNSSYGAANHSHAYSFPNFGFGNVTSNHGGVDVGISAASGLAHSHSAGMTFGSGSGANNLLANSGNAGGPIQFVNKPHSHNGSGSTNYNSANHNNHSHNAGTATEASRPVAHNTGHSLTARPSGNAASAKSYQPFIIMNYIVKV